MCLNLGAAPKKAAPFLYHEIKIQFIAGTVA